MLKILLADDIQLWVEFLLEAFEDHPVIQFVGSVANEEQLLDYLKRDLPDLLLLDLGLNPDKPISLNLAKQLQDIYPTLRIVLLTSAIKNTRLIQEANKMGLDGYINKNISKAELISLLLKAEQGVRVFSDNVKDALIQINKDGVRPLTPREREIAECIYEEMTRASTMAKLNIKTGNTYDAHVQHIKDKLGAKSTNELRRKIAELGYV